MHPFSKVTAETVSSLGEQKLLLAMRRWLGRSAPIAPAGMGDDCAVLPVPSARRAPLITVDPVIYGEHFDDNVPPREAGAKLLRRNLSDIAAMGGKPTAAVIALALDPHTRLDWLEAFYRGIAAVSRSYAVPIVGGDIATHRGGIVATLTLIGETTCARALTRTGARAGDFIAVTGALGNTLASGHHARFTPRLEEGRWLVRRPEVTAMLDLSDGLAKDIHSLTPRGGTPLLFEEVMPLRKGADLRAALTDGEDYELLFTVRGGAASARRLLAAWRRRFPRIPLTVIGRFERGGSPSAGAINLRDYAGFEHLKA